VGGFSTLLAGFAGFGTAKLMSFALFVGHFSAFLASGASLFAIPLVSCAFLVGGFAPFATSFTSRHLFIVFLFIRHKKMLLLSFATQKALLCFSHLSVCRRDIPITIAGKDTILKLKPGAEQ
jgi:hypothetical protein